MTARRVTNPLIVVILTCLAAALCWWSPETAHAENVADGPELLKQARIAFEKRQETKMAKRALDLYEKTVEAAPSYQALWEGARAAAHYGDNCMKKASRRERTAVYRKGEEWARRAAKMQPGRVEGHFYVAVLVGMRSRSQSVLHQASVAGEIRQRAEKAVKFDRAFECAAPLRMLGQYYLRLPAAFGGDNKRALGFFVQAAKLCPTDVSNHLHLAEALHSQDQDARARKELQWVLDHPPSDPHDRDDYKQVRQQALEFLDDWY